MTVPRARLLGTLAAIALITGPVSARAESATVPLAGTTTISAALSSSVVVEVPKDLPYSLGSDTTGLLSVRGNGRVVAATLQPVASREASEAMVVAAFNGCAAPGCAPEAGQSPWLYRREPTGARRAPDGRPVLAAGKYRLSVLTDGAPVEVQIKLDGVDSQTSAATTDPAESGITPAAEVLAVPASPVVWSGSADLTFASENSLLLAYLQQDSPTGAVAGLSGVCHFTGSTRPLLGVPAPGCPFDPNGSDGEARVGSVETETFTLGNASRSRLATALSPTTGGQQAGLWSTRAAVTTTPLAFFAWLAL